MGSDKSTQPKRERESRCTEHNPTRLYTTLQAFMLILSATPKDEGAPAKEIGKIGDEVNECTTTADNVPGSVWPTPRPEYERGDKVH